LSSGDLRWGYGRLDRLTRIVASMPAPVASGWSDVAGWALHPLESAALSRRTLIPDVALRADPTSAEFFERHDPPETVTSLRIGAGPILRPV
jgi:hypothetical protein